eukprot:1925040-Alexandrium_andersonii.AAC.1
MKGKFLSCRRKLPPSTRRFWGSRSGHLPARRRCVSAQQRRIGCTTGARRPGTSGRPSMQRG